MSITSRASCSVTLRRCLGSNRSTAKPQKSHLALQTFVMANWRYPGTPCWSTSRSKLNRLVLGRCTGREKSTPGPTVAVGAAVRFNRAVLMPVKSRILPGKPTVGQIFLGWDGGAAVVDFPKLQLQIGAMKYRVVIEPDEDGVFVAECPALPGCISQGKTRAGALANIRDAMTGYLASLKKHGEPTP